MKTRHSYSATILSLAFRSSAFLLGLFFLIGCAASNPEYDNLMARGDYNEAKQLIHRLLDEYSYRDWNPTMPARRAQLYYWLATAHAKLEEYDSLQLALSLCVSNDPGFGKAREQFLSELAQSEYNKAVASYNAGAYSEAMAHWKTALDLVAPIAAQPFQARIHRDLGFVRMAANDTAQAVQDFRQSADLGDPTSQDLLLAYQRTGTSSRPPALPQLKEIRSLIVDSPATASSRHQEPSVNSSTPFSNHSSAIQFHLVGGYAVSYLGSLSPSSAFRITADLYLNSRSIEGPIKSSSSSYTQDRSRSTNSDSYGADVVVSHVSYAAVTDNSSFYFGLGPVASYTSSSSKDIDAEHPSFSSPGYHNEYSTRASQWGIGAQGIVGLQAMLTSTVSFLAEYQVSALHIWQESRSDYSFSSASGSDFNWSTTEQRGWQFNLNSIRLGIAVFI